MRLDMTLSELLKYVWGEQLEEEGHKGCSSGLLGLTEWDTDEEIARRKRARYEQRRFRADLNAILNPIPEGLSHARPGFAIYVFSCSVEGCTNTYERELPASLTPEQLAQRMPLPCDECIEKEVRNRARREADQG